MKKDLLKKSLLVSLALILLSMSSEKTCRAQYDLSDVPKVGSFLVEQINGMRDSEYAELVCIDENADIRPYAKNIAVDETGTLIHPLAIDPSLCEHRCYAFKLTDMQGGERYSYPFVCFLAGRGYEANQVAPEIITVDFIRTESTETATLLPLVKNVGWYFVSGDIEGENEWKEFEGLPISVTLKNPLGTNEIYLTFANGSLMETVPVILTSSIASEVQKDLESLVNVSQAGLLNKLLSGKAINEEELLAIIKNPENMNAILDPDGDGLMTDQELDLGTDPKNADTDTDGVTDGNEVLFFGTDPLAIDSHEGLSFVNIGNNETLENISSEILGHGAPNSEVKIQVISTDSGAILYETELMTDAAGTFTFNMPEELDNKNFEISATQKEAVTKVSAVSMDTSRNSLDFSLDALNEYEIHMSGKRMLPVAAIMGKDERLTVFGSLKSKLLTENMLVTVIVRDAETKEAVDAASINIHSFSQKPFSVLLPKLPAGSYEITVQASGPNSLGPSVTVPVTIEYTETELHLAAQSSKVNPYLIAFMLAVSTISVYAFNFHRRNRQ